MDHYYERGGMRDHGGVPAFAPRLPSRIERLAFSLFWRGQRLHVTVRPGEATYALRDGHRAGPVRLWHHGEPLTLASGDAVTRPIPPIKPMLGSPPQPPGRLPAHRIRLCR